MKTRAHIVSLARLLTLGAVLAPLALSTLGCSKGGADTGPIVATATGEALGGEWVSGKASPALPWGVYTAVASQPSSIGNPTGTSSPVTFAVQAIAPTVATEGAADVTRTSAALYASVNPRGGGVSACYFEYGSTAAKPRG